MMKWTDHLNASTYNRLADCHSRKEDIPELVGAKWAWMQERGKDKEGFTKEDALVSILELLDCNSQYFDLTSDEYNELIG